MVKDSMIFGLLTLKTVSKNFYLTIIDGCNWSKEEITKGDLPIPRCLHSIVFFSGELFIFGGSIMEFEKPHEDIIIFNPTSNSFFIPERTYNRTEVKWRKAHASFNVKNHMIIHGGIDEFENFLGDAWILNLISLKWDVLDTRGSSLGAIAYHSCCVAINSDKFNHKNFELYRSSDIILTSRSNTSKIKYEGVYFFGGLDQYNNSYGDVKILKIGRKPCEWINVKIDGRGPRKRNSATINFYEDLNMLIVYGGRNLSESPMFYSDIFILDLENSQWLEATLQISPGIDLCRSGHCSCIWKNNLIIFGGMNSQSFVGSDTIYINLDLIAKYEERDMERINNINMIRQERKKKTKSFQGPN